MSAQTLYVIGKTPDISTVYKLGERIGQPGQFGYAQVCKHIATGALRAVKVISKARFLRSADKESHFKQLRAEIEVMRNMDHPNIIKMFDVFENDTELFIVMEYCQGGELFDRIKAQGVYSEQDASKVLRQICSGLQYMHSKKIAHCDLKPDNFLFLNANNDSLKIIDFGMSKFCQKRKYFKTICGTPYYVAPEVIAGQYNQHSDMWSIGVVMFVMLFGFPPFYADPQKYGAQTDDKIFELVLAGFDPTTRPGYGPFFPRDIQVSDSAKDLMSKLLTRNIAKRFTATEALNHPWLLGETAPHTPIDRMVLHNLRKFNANTQFKQGVLRLMSGSLSATEIKDLQAKFRMMDANGDGHVTVEELRSAMKQSNMDAKEAEALLKIADLDGDGVLSYEELMMTAVQRKLLSKEERLWETFRKLDLNGDGFVSAEEIMQVLGKDSLEKAKQLIAEADKNGDGMICYDEFITMWGDIDDAESA